ncbi:MAG: site-specific DNA-methyltransferase [Candidatus Bathyarchaeota archaeon]|nr:site-specific DNA-methyltransferase [Candidatus Bathyarchaeota archaeon]
MNSRKAHAMRTQHKIIFGSSQRMTELADSSVHLMVTSPPYPMIEMWDSLFAKMDLSIAELWRKLEAERREENVTQIYEHMHGNLAEVWREAHRVLVDGGIACINIGDTVRTVNGSFRLFANHSKIIEHCERIGFTTLPYILWKKPTTKPKYNGKGAFLGSGFLPPNAYVTLDCEFILLFRKGKLRRFQPHDQRRYDSAFEKSERDEWFSQIWTLTGARQTESQLERRIAAFPEELANRLVRMFSVKGDTVLDPFLGSGTTAIAAMRNERNSIGYEVDESLLPLITKKLVLGQQKVSLRHEK